MRLTRHEQQLAAAGTLMNVYRFRCAACGALSTGRRPQDSELIGDGTLMYPRRHSAGAGACPGNVQYAIEVRFDPTTFRVVEEARPDC